MKKTIKIFLLSIMAAFLCMQFSSIEGFAKEAKNEVKKEAKKETKKEPKKEVERMNNRVVITDDTTYNTQRITLHWKQIKKVSGYEIYRKQGKSGKFELVKTVKDNKKVKWTDKSVKSDKTYYYKIRTYKKTKKKTKYGYCSKIYTKKAFKELTKTVTKYTSVRYVGGGRSTKGWDCSGFTQWAMKEYFGVDIPKPAATQGVSGKKISKNNRSKWKPGDILVYSNGRRICHVALYIGDGKLMHALNEKYDTIIQDVSYYERWDSGTYLVDVRRFF